MRRRLRNLDRGPQAATGYPACVMTHRPAARSAVRSVLAGALVAGVLFAVPASADAPSSWESSPDVSGFEALMVLFLIPLGLFIVISLLAALPSLVKGDSYEPGQAWRSEGEWFGGPLKGVAGADQVDPKQLESAGDQGGAGARF